MPPLPSPPRRMPLALDLVDPPPAARRRPPNLVLRVPPALAPPLSARLPPSSPVALASPVAASAIVSAPPLQDAEARNAYPDGPVDVYGGAIFLFSEPSRAVAAQYDVVINVAREVINPFAPASSSPPPTAATTTPMTVSSPEYIFVPWEHTSKLTSDLPYLTDVMALRAAEGKRILVHCQCGVSRSASLVVAYVMKEKSWDLNQAYAFVKRKAPAIGPNMGLIFQLMEWGRILNNQPVRDADDSDSESLS
ncbi:dual specificity phosphatase [Myxozyma melibiosi]|uniref:protein-tyrosine-phosphatase n=1 Tax=Myxozyma melibiosi TaxID=54550 RepID=A0ABR1F9L5_9ASCO